MAIRVEDIGEVGYGGLVTLAKWWDEQRMTDGRLSDAEVMKKAETYAYLVPGGAATIMSAFGVMRRQQVWLEHISHGFMYAFPNWIRDVIMSMQGTAAKSAAVREAQRIVGNTQRQLGQGQRTGRSYQPEFRRVTAW